MEIGSIVECINDNWDCNVSKIKMPVKGRLYTVTGFCFWPKGQGIYIEECSDIIGVMCHVTKRDLGLHKTPFLKSRFIERLENKNINVDEMIEQEVQHA